MTITRDEIIEMAKQAGLNNPLWLEHDYAIVDRFANLCFEKGRQQGMKQENALWKLAETSRDIGYDK